MPRIPEWMDLYQLWFRGASRGRNQLCGILLQSAHGFRFCKGSKFAISHWLGRSPLTQCWRYRAAFDVTIVRMKMVGFKNPLTKLIFVKIAQWGLPVLHCLGGDACFLVSTYKQLICDISLLTTELISVQRAVAGKSAATIHRNPSAVLYRWLIQQLCRRHYGFRGCWHRLHGNRLGLPSNSPLLPARCGCRRHRVISARRSRSNYRSHNG